MSTDAFTDSIREMLNVHPDFGSLSESDQLWAQSQLKSFILHSDLLNPTSAAAARANLNGIFAELGLAPLPLTEEQSDQSDSPAIPEPRLSSVSIIWSDNGVHSAEFAERAEGFLSRNSESPAKVEDMVNGARQFISSDFMRDDDDLIAFCSLLSEELEVGFFALRTSVEIPAAFAPQGWIFHADGRISSSTTMADL